MHYTVIYREYIFVHQGKTNFPDTSLYLLKSITVTKLPIMTNNSIILTSVSTWFGKSLELSTLAINLVNYRK